MRLLLAALLLTTSAHVGGARAGEVWITNEKDNTLSVIDTETLEVTATHPVGLRPRGITFAPDHSELFICASDDDAVQVIDPSTGQVIRTLDSGEDPEQFAMHPDGDRLYIANEEDALATVLDVQTGEALAEINVGIEPEGMAVSPDGTLAVVTSETTNMVHWIDTGAAALTANTLVGQRPRDARFTPDGGRLWVSAEIGGTVTVLDVATKTELAKIEFALPGVSPDRIQPVGMAITGDGARVFVALGPANHVAVVDAETYEVLDYLVVGKRVWHMTLAENDTLLFTTNGLSGDVTVIDVAALKPVKTIKVGRLPWGAAYRP